MTRNAKVFSAFLICFLIMPARLFAAPPPTIGQGMSGETRTLEMQEKEKALQKQIREKKKKPQVEEKLPQEAPPAIASEKVLIKIINVKGVTLIPDKDISEITKGYEGREITLGEMQKMADLITDLYRKKGYITCAPIFRRRNLTAARWT